MRILDGLSSPVTTRPHLVFSAIANMLNKSDGHADEDPDGSMQRPRPVSAFITHVVYLTNGALKVDRESLKVRYGTFLLAPILIDPLNLPLSRSVWNASLSNRHNRNSMRRRWELLSRSFFHTRKVFNPRARLNYPSRQVI